MSTLLNNLKSITIDIPSGYEIDKTNSTFERIVFKPLTPVLPKRWEDLKRIHGSFTEVNSLIGTLSNGFANAENKNTWPTHKLAEASIALAQLCQLRDVYNDGWVADSLDGTVKFNIAVDTNRFITIERVGTHNVLSFKSKDLRTQFLTNFKDLLEIAKPLL